MNGDGGDELRSVVRARGEQRRGWGPGGERRGAGGEGECVALAGASGRRWEAGGGRGAWPHAGRVPVLLAGRKTTGEERWAGRPVLGRQMVWAGWADR